MLRDVRSNVTDGLLGFATATGDGLQGSQKKRNTASPFVALPCSRVLIAMG